MPLLCLAFKILIRLEPIASLLSLLFSSNYPARLTSSDREIGPYSPYLSHAQNVQIKHYIFHTFFFQILKSTKMIFGLSNQFSQLIPGSF